MDWLRAANLLAEARVLLVPYKIQKGPLGGRFYFRPSGTKVYGLPPKARRSPGARRVVGDAAAAKQLLSAVNGKNPLGVSFKAALRDSPIDALHVRPRVRNTIGKHTSGTCIQTIYEDGSAYNEVRVSLRPKRTLRQSPPGAWSISAMARTPEEAAQRTMAHEVTHHLYRGLPDSWKETLESAYKSRRREVRRCEAEACLDATRQPISRYGLSNAREWIAESVSGILFEPDALAKHDPKGYLAAVDFLEKIGSVDAERSAKLRKKVLKESAPALSEVPTGEGVDWAAVYAVVDRINTAKAKGWDTKQKIQLYKDLEGAGGQAVAEEFGDMFDD